MSLDRRGVEFVLGKPLDHDLYNRDKKLLLRKGVCIDTPRQLDALLNRGIFLDDPHVNKPQEPGAYQGREASTTLPFDGLDPVRARLENMYGKERVFKSLCPIVTSLCRVVQKMCDQDADACLSTLLRPSNARYSVKHMVDTAVACEIVTKRMGYSQEDRLSILAAALTMNIAMYHVQDFLYFQKDPVGRIVRTKINAHVLEGVDILVQCNVMDQTWIDTVFQHHEQMDGNGYPYGLRGEQIFEPARILRIADIYCAKVSGRAYRKPLAPLPALREIYTNARGHFVDSGLVGIFIKEFGLYPPGCYVRLANGDIAIVVHRGENPHQPRVRSILRGSGVPYLKPILHDSANQQYAIQGTVWMSQRMAFVDRNWLWGHGS